MLRRLRTTHRLTSVAPGRTGSGRGRRLDMDTASVPLLAGTATRRRSAGAPLCSSGATVCVETFGRSPQIVLTRIGLAPKTPKVAHGVCAGQAASTASLNIVQDEEAFSGLQAGSFASPVSPRTQRTTSVRRRSARERAPGQSGQYRRSRESRRVLRGRSGTGSPR